MRERDEHMNNAHSHEEMVQEYWGREQSILDDIYSRGMQKHAESLPDFARAFDLRSRTIRCIDEGIAQDGISLAGSGVLLDERAALDVLSRANADGVTAHEGCGAVQLALKKAGKGSADADAYAEAWAMNLAQKAGVPYKGLIRLKDMARPVETHIARTVYYDGTGRLALSGVSGFPCGFIVSRKYLNPDYAVDELGVAISIALGDHGFGELITEHQPLLVIPVSFSERSDCSADDLNREIRSGTHVWGKRVHVAALTVSKNVLAAR